MQSIQSATNSPRSSTSSGSLESDIHSALGLGEEDDDVILEETQIEDQDVERHDNEQEYQSQRKWYEVLTVIMCCSFLFSASYSKATTKDMQMTLPNAHQILEEKQPGSGVYPYMDYDTISSKILTWIGLIDAPPIFIAPFAGYLLNRYNSKIALMLFMMCCFIGSGCCSLSVFYRIVELFPFGRVVFGLGVGCLRIAVNVVIKESVSAQQLSVYMQFPRTAEKAASMIDGYFVSWPLIKDKFTEHARWVSLPFIVGTGLVAISLPFFILFAYEPKNKNDILDKQSVETKVTQKRTNGQLERDEEEEQQQAEGGQTKNEMPLHTQVNVLREPFIANPFCFVWMKLMTFPKSYWLIIVISFFNDACTGTYQGYLPQFVNVYNIPKEPTSFWQDYANIRQIPAYLAIISPLFGLVVDWSGNKRHWLLLGGCIGLVIHHAINVLFAVLIFNGYRDEVYAWSWIMYPNLLFQGFSNAFIGSILIPGIAFVTERSALSVAYGFHASIGAVASSLFAILMGHLKHLQNHALKDIHVAAHETVPVTKYTILMSGVFAICAVLGMLFIFVFVYFYKKDICPPEAAADPRVDGIKIVQDMEDKNDVVTIRKPKLKNASKRRLKWAAANTYADKRRTMSVHYISRFG